MSTETGQQIPAVIRIGVRRMPLAPSGYLDGIDSDGEEAAALREMALYSLMSRAGALPSSCQPLPGSPKEDYRIVWRAANPLAEALDGSHWPLVKEWIQTADRLKVVVPHQVVDRLLAANSQLKMDLRSVLGARGRWLADLQGIEPGPPVYEWEELRSSDPDAFRERLSQEMGGLDWKERLEAVKAIEIGLSEADGALLDKAVADRRQEVREVAKDLAVQLRGSELARQALALAGTILRIEKSFLSKKLVVMLPEANAIPSILALGAPSLENVGPNATAMVNVVRHVPPAALARQLGEPMGTILDLVAKTDHTAPLFSSLADAAIRFRDREWADAVYLQLNDKTDKHRALRRSLVPCLSDGLFERDMLRRLKDFETDQPAAHLIMADLNARQRILSPAVTEAFLRAFVRAKALPFYELGRAGYCMHPSAAAMLAITHEGPPSFLDIWDRWRQIVHLRQRLEESFETARP